jgi:hypothetical protein
VQFGGGSSLITKALKGKDVSKMSDAQIVDAIQAYKADHNDDLFKSSSANVRAGTLARASKERDALLTLAAGTDVKPVAAAASSSSSGVMQVAMSPTPAIPATSAVQPLFTMPRQEAQMPSKNTTVAQDVSDRKVAHIVTGGLGGSLA